MVRAARKAKGGAQAALEAMQLAEDRRWAMLHPARAEAERGLRKQVKVMRTEAGRGSPGTPETHYHARRFTTPPAAKLYAKGHIDAAQLNAAVHLAGVFRQLTAEVRVRTISLETRVDGGGRIDAGEREALGRMRDQAAWGDWRRATAHIDAVLTVLIEEVDIRPAAMRHRMRDTTLIGHVRRALDLWLVLRRAATREIDEDDAQRTEAWLAR